MIFVPCSRRPRCSAPWRVAISAVVTAAAAHELFSFSWSKSLLLGAVVGSTDAAAVFATLRFTRLRRRLATLLAVESGANDPMAVALTLGLIAWVEHSDYGVGDFAVLLVRQFALGLVVGILLGFIASRLLRRLPTDLAPFASVASIGTAALAYGVTASLDGSGFLAVYLVALWVGNTAMPLRRTIVTFHEGLAFLAQVVLFIVLGLLVFPSQLGDVAWSGLALTAVLLFAARPLAVVAALTPFGYRLREQLFLSWAGLRGAVPIVLATFALSAEVSGSATIFNAVFFVVLVSTLAQGMTLESFAAASPRGRGYRSLVKNDRGSSASDTRPSCEVTARLQAQHQRPVLVQDFARREDRAAPRSLRGRLHVRHRHAAGERVTRAAQAR